jgi:hypothetical protein
MEENTYSIDWNMYLRSKTMNDDISLLELVMLCVTVLLLVNTGVDFYEAGQTHTKDRH